MGCATTRSPRAVPYGRIVISKPAMQLTLYDARNRVVVRYNVACGAVLGDKQCEGDMRTPEGCFRVQEIRDAALWSHDFGDGKGEIAGAYGPYFIRLYTPPHTGIGIHGTHAPASIGSRVTEGCIRLSNEDLRALMPYVVVGMEVEITTESGELVR